MNPPLPVASPSAEACLKKRWLYLLPAVFITYSLAYLDRANYGFGAAAGLAATLHINGNQASLLSGLFFLGYFFFQIPSAAFAHRRSASGLVFGALIAWGVLAALTGVLTQFWMLAIDRFLLGVAESCIFPAMLLLLTRWFTRAERSRANTFLILGNPVTVIWMSAITGFLIQDFGWQKTFMLEGIPSVLWAVVWILFVRDRPAKASWITPEAAEVLEQRLAQEQQSVPPAGAVRSALLRPDVILLSVQYFFWSIGVYGFVLWLPTIVHEGSSLSMASTGLISACPYVFAVILMLIVSYVSDKTLKRSALVWPLLLLSGFALFGSFLFAQKSFLAAFVCLIVAGGCMYAPYGPFFAMIPERVSREVTAEVIAMINSCGALGGFCGSYLVGLLRARTGDDRAGFLFMSVSLLCSGAIILFLGASKKTPTAALVPEAH
jgi:sugar phosphate permease